MQKVYGYSYQLLLSKYAKYNFNRTTINHWKAKCRVANPTFKSAGRLRLETAFILSEY